MGNFVWSFEPSSKFYAELNKYCVNKNNAVITVTLDHKTATVTITNSTKNNGLKRPVSSFSTELLEEFSVLYDKSTAIKSIYYGLERLHS